MTQAEYEEGVHYDLAVDNLTEQGYDSPFVHFDEFDAPDFLIPAVQSYLARANETDANPTH